METTEIIVSAIEDFEFENTEDGKGVIIKSVLKEGNRLIFPDKINGNPVTIVGCKSYLPKSLSPFFQCFHAENQCLWTTVKLPKYLKKIEMCAFNGWNCLTGITLPDELQEIGNSAFGFCSSLKELTIPNSVTHIGMGAFCGCSSLVTVNLPSHSTKLKIEDYAFAGCFSLEDKNILKEYGYCKQF